MTIEMVRDDLNDVRTLGTMTFPAIGKYPTFVCHTLEDVARETKIAGTTCIPTGVYRVTITHSKRFNKMLPLLHGVKGFGGVRIHSGNTIADTAGCPLVGMTRNQSQESDLLILRSREAMREVQPRISAAIDAGEEVWLDIIAPRVTTEERFEIQVL